MLRSVSIYSVLNCYFDDIFSETCVMVAVGSGYMSVIVGIYKSYAVVFIFQNHSNFKLIFVVEFCFYNVYMKDLMIDGAKRLPRKGDKI